ncbi:MAG: hypothetical protein ABII72_00940 [Parcubacteria group bacterium]
MKSFLIGASAGLINGLGLVFQGLLTGGKWNISLIFPIIAVASLCILVPSSQLILGEAITWQKVIGVALGAVALYLLNL